MKKKSLKLRLPYSFGQRIRSKDSLDRMPTLINPGSEWQGFESVIEDILRWADDGGKMVELENRTTKSDSEAAWEQSNKTEYEWNRKVSGNDDSSSSGAVR